MPSTDPGLVSIGLPVRNGADRIGEAVASVLAQDHQNLELVISDNASTDSTEELCRSLAAADPRIRYHRQAENIGLLNNFAATIQLASGEYFRWMSDDDKLEPGFVSACLQTFAADPRLVLVTGQTAYVGEDGTVETAQYHGTGFASDDPAVRFGEMLRLLNQSHLVLDPLYGLVRRAPVAGIDRRNMLHEDEIFAARMALLGPWGHRNEVLARRNWKSDKLGPLARRLGVPSWHARMATALQCRELMRCVREAELTPEQRKRANAAITGLYFGRHKRVLARRGRKLARYATRLVPRRAAS